MEFVGVFPAFARLMLRDRFHTRPGAWGERRVVL